MGGRRLTGPLASHQPPQGNPSAASRSSGRARSRATSGGLVRGKSVEAAPAAAYPRPMPSPFGPAREDLLHGPTTVPSRGDSAAAGAPPASRDSSLGLWPVFDTTDRVVERLLRARALRFRRPLPKRVVERIGHIVERSRRWRQWVVAHLEHWCALRLSRLAAAGRGVGAHCVLPRVSADCSSAVGKRNAPFLFR